MNKRTFMCACVALPAALASLRTAAQSGVSCAIDQSGMYFTGKVRTEMGKLLREYKCPKGHVVWLTQ